MRFTRSSNKTDQIDTDEVTLDGLKHRVDRFEVSLARKNWAILILSIALVISSSGWWFSSRDRAATVRNGEVANCRAEELARDLDEFRTIVSPTASQPMKGRAARHLSLYGPLSTRYERCGGG